MLSTQTLLSPTGNTEDRRARPSHRAQHSPPFIGRSTPTTRRSGVNAFSSPILIAFRAIFRILITMTQDFYWLPRHSHNPRAARAQEQKRIHHGVRAQLPELDPQRGSFQRGADPHRSLRRSVHVRSPVARTGAGPGAILGALHRQKNLPASPSGNARWSDGRPSLQRISCAHVQDARPECRLRDVLRFITGAKEYRMGTDRIRACGIKAIDSRTLEVTLLRPVAYFTGSLPQSFSLVHPPMRR